MEAECHRNSSLVLCVGGCPRVCITATLKEKLPTPFEQSSQYGTQGQIKQGRVLCRLFGVFPSAFLVSSSPSSSSFSSSYHLLRHIQILPSLHFIPFPFCIFLFTIRLSLLTVFLLFLWASSPPSFSSGGIRIDGAGLLFSIGLKSFLIKHYLRIKI